MSTDVGRRPPRSPETSPFRSLGDLIASGKYLRSLDSRYSEAMQVQTLDTDQKYLAALTGQRAVRDALLQMMDRERVDALVFPVRSLPAPLLGTAERGGPADNPVSASAGLPAVVLAAGTTADGLPIAIEFMGRPFSEAVLLRIAALSERLRGPRPLPPTTAPLPGERISY